MSDEIPEKRINIYVCDACGAETVTVDVDSGTTPYLLHRPYARHTEGCAERFARSSFYRPRPGHPPPAWEWYRPTEEEARNADRKARGMYNHYVAGGLFIRAHR